jgi:hypothetical protein
MTCFKDSLLNSGRENQIFPIRKEYTRSVMETLQLKMLQLIDVPQKIN